MTFSLSFALMVIMATSWAATVSGNIKDFNTGKTIPNANITIRETDQGTASNHDGYFEFNIKNGIYTLETSVIGFKRDSREIVIENNNLEININLQTAILKFSEVQVRGLFSTRLGNESIDIVNYDKIKSMNKESVSDMLKDIPGIDAQFAHPNGRNVNLSIRGSSDYKPGGYNNRVLILLDGFPILIPNSGSPDWNSLPLESLERIEIQNSPASTQYGHNSMGGVINLITDDGSKKNSTKIRLSGGSYSRGQTSISHRNQKEKLYYGIGAMVQASAGHRFNAYNQTNRLRTYLRYNHQQGSTLRLSNILSFSNIGHPGFVGSPSYRKSERLSQYYQLNGFHSIGNGLSMSHSIFLNKFNTQYKDILDTPEDEKQNTTNYDDLNIGLRSEILITKWARWILMFGSDLDWSVSDVDLFHSEYKSPSQLSIGGFIQSKYSIGSGWNLGSGLRYDYRRSDPGKNYPKGVYTNWSPKINLMYSMRHKETFTLSYSEGFRAPSLSELYLEYISPYLLIMKGNPDIMPERVSAIELMYKYYHNKSWFWSISIFNNQYENMIDFVYATPVEAINRKGVTANGFEYEFNYKPFEAMSISSSYALLNMWDRDGAPILYRSQHSGCLYLNFHLTYMNIRIGTRAWSEQTFYDFLDHVSSEEEKYKTLPSRIIPELILLKEIGSYAGSIHISNIYDTQYELIQDYPMPGRTWQLTITKTIKKEIK